MTKESIKHLSDVLKAYIDGETIQYLNNGQWFDFLEEELENEHLSSFEFRIKPKQKWRPYKNAEEFINAQKEHGPYFKSCGQFFLPVMVDRDNGIVCSDIDGTSFIDYQGLLNTRVWQDRTRCGIEED